MKKSPPFNRKFLTKLFYLLLLTSAINLFQSPTNAKSSPAAEVSLLIERLCGELVFITDFRTDLKTIGLRPCGGAKPYIFYTGPKELHNYYQFENVKIGRGDVIRTLEWGKLDTYIVAFDSYIELNHCGDCGNSFVPTYTLLPTLTSQFSPTVTPTRQFPPTPTPWTSTKESSATPTATLTATIIPTNTIDETGTAAVGTNLPTISATQVIESTTTPTQVKEHQNGLGEYKSILIIFTTVCIALLILGGLLTILLLRRRQNRS